MKEDCRPIKWKNLFTWWWSWRRCWTTIFKRISDVTWSTSTQRQMVHNLTICVWSANTRTRILAFIKDTSLVGRAISIQDTLWSTTFVWITNVVSNARTRSSSVLFTANSIHTTRRWMTRCTDFLRSWISWKRKNNKSELLTGIISIWRCAFTFPCDLHS